MKLSSPQSRASFRELILAFWLGLIAISIAIAFRTPQLDLRPMHVDESTQAIKFKMLTEGKYQYDAKDHHGPTQLYIAGMVKKFAGVSSFNEMTENNFRSVAVIGGVLLVLLIPLLGDGLGKLPAACAMLFTAISPMLVFYSRYFIMEIWLAVFSLATIGFGWRFYRTRGFGWLVCCGASLGLMHATKETFIIHAAAMVIAMVAVSFSDFMTSSLIVDRNRPEAIGTRHFSALMGVAIFVSVACFTQGFSHIHAAWDSLATYGNYVGGRSEGMGHQKPFYYYFMLLLGNKGGNFWAPGVGESAFSVGGKFFWSEAVIYVLALIGMVRIVIGRGRGYEKKLVLFLAVYAVVQLGIYSFVAYKTPWCILSAHHAFVLLAGFGVCGLFSDLAQTWLRWLTGALALVGTAHLALQAWRANFKDDPTLPRILRTGDHFARAECPYAYGYTPVGLKDGLVKKIQGYAEKQPGGASNLHIAIASPGLGWPLHWYLRKFAKVDFGPSVISVPPHRELDISADVILVDPSMVSLLPTSIRGKEDSATHKLDVKAMLNQQYSVEGYVKKELLSSPPAPPTPSEPQP